MASFNTTRKNERLFNSPLIKRFSPGSVDDEVSSNEIVYHYTSPEAFLSIIRSHTLRFTDIHYLNDKSEGIYFTKLLLDFMDEYHDKGFCCKQGLIVPYLSISFPEKSIYRITLAPMLEFDIAKSSIRELLSMSGIEKVRVDKSSIPIRF